MARPHRMTPAALLLLGSFIGTGAAFAQQPREPARVQAAPAQATPEAGAPEQQADEQAESFPVFAITSVEVLRSTHAPVTDVVVVNGLTSADGWSGGELVPLRHGTTSSDGVLDVIFVAEAPQESAAPTHYMPIQAILPLPSGHQFKAIRVRAATNSLLAHDLPGVAEARQPAEPCKDCVGKLFVAKNGAVPAGASATDVVREEELPALARVVRPDDGIADTKPNPNRLTIIVGDDGHIVDAAWE
jgi:hypothetical protein